MTLLRQIFPKKLVSFSTWIDHTRWARNTWAMAAIFILTMADIMDMVGASLAVHVCVLLCSGLTTLLSLIVQLSCLSRLPAPGGLPPGPSSSSSSSSLLGHVGCFNNPKYYSYTAVLALMATTMLVQVSHMVKVTLMLLIATATGIVNIYSWRDIFDRYDTARFQDYRCPILVPRKALCWLAGWLSRC